MNNIAATPHSLIITSAAIATLISAVITVIVNFVLNRSKLRETLENRLHDILKIAVQYPLFEQQWWTDTWTGTYSNDDTMSQRYELYGTIVYNYLEQLTKYYHYKTTKIENALDMKSWVKIHRNYWRNPTVAGENDKVYEKDFVKIVNTYLEEIDAQTGIVNS
jgi:hypothetical protein